MKTLAVFAIGYFIGSMIGHAIAGWYAGRRGAHERRIVRG